MATHATFGAGCFWGVEATFQALNGVTKTAVGYMGGETDSPSYQNVCSGSTGHAEIVQIEFDPAIISYEKLLDTFWNSHNPTTLNRQDSDIGTQYRSVIFFHNEDQQQAATDSKNKLNQSDCFSSPIVTEIAPATTFHRAEEYHQQYLEKGGQSSCQL